MARMPGAIWKPLAADWNKQPRMKAYDFFCLHTMVGGLDGTDGYFRNKNGIGYGGTESHFGVGPDGTIFQWQDTDFQADANGNGNWHVISSENADTGAPFPKWGGSDVPAMTAQQVEGNAQIAVWLWRTHGIPLGLTPDSRPGRRGLAVHRWGVPGYMVPGAEQWSTSKGKACPGDRRVAQAPLVSARAQQIAGGPPATPIEEDDMFNDDDRRILRVIGEELRGGPKWEGWPGLGPDGARGSVVQGLVETLNNTRRIAGLEAAVTALSKTIAQQAGGEDVDVQALAAHLDATVRQAMADTVKVQVSVDADRAPAS